MTLSVYVRSTDVTVPWYLSPPFIFSDNRFINKTFFTSIYELQTALQTVPLGHVRILSNFNKRKSTIY